MSAFASVIPLLEGAIQYGTLERCTLMVRRLAALFVDNAPRFNDEHIGLFDDVLCRLVPEIDGNGRAELSERLAPVVNAPPELMRTLARDGDIAVARPALLHSARLREADLVEIAASNSQAHLAAIAGRRGIDEPVTDVLVRRGDTTVLSDLAGNPSARLSEGGFFELVRRAEGDSRLTETVGRRPDIPGHLFRALLVEAPPAVQERLLVAATPEMRAEIKRELERAISDSERAAPRDQASAQRAVSEMHQAGKLGETELAALAGSKRYHETVAALSLLCGVPIEVADRLMSGDRPDPVLILCKAAGYGWETTRAIITARPGSKNASKQALDAAFGNFEKLSAATAQRVVRFWQVRQPDDAA